MDCISDWCPWKTSNVSSSKRLWWSLGGIGTGIITIMYRKKLLWVIDARFFNALKTVLNLENVKNTKIFENKNYIRCAIELIFADNAYYALPIKVLMT
jgi:hypothetical protein